MMTTIRSTPSIAYLAIVAALAINTGCSMPKASKLFSMDSTWPWRDSDEPREGTPIRMAGTWTDTVLHKAGQTPQRGFGGRVAFFDRDGKQPILVDGQLVVYAFDEAGRDPTDNKPTRRYVFPADQLPMHMSKSELGATYSFWLPWDDAGGPKTEVSLICRFEPKKGSVITSEQTRHLLPGQELPSAALAKQPPKLPEGVPARPALPTLESLHNARKLDPNLRPAGYDAVAEPAATGVLETHVETTTLVPDRRMKVSSITLPKNYEIPAAANVVPNAAATPAKPVPQAPSPLPQPAVQPQPQAQPPAAPTVPPRPTTNSWITAPAVQPQAPGFGSHQLAAPQLITPQLMTVQPAQMPTPAMPATVTAPAPRPQ